MTDTFITVNPGQDVESSHHNDLAEGLSGVAGAGRLIRANQVNDATSHVAEFVNKHASGPIARFGYGTGPTWALDINATGVTIPNLSLTSDLNVPGTLSAGTLAPTNLTVSGAVTLGASKTSYATNFKNRGPYCFDAAAYISHADGTVNDIAEFDAWVSAINAAGGEGYWNPGLWRFDSTMKIANISTAITIKGAGQGLTTILYGGSNSGTNVLELFNVNNSTFQDFQIQMLSGASSPGSAALCGILMTCSAGNANNANTLKRIAFSNPTTVGTPFAGTTAVGLLVLYATGDNQFDHINLNAHDNRNTCPTVVMTTTNGYSLSAASGTIITGTQNTGDNHFIKCEVHNFSKSSNPVILDGVGHTQFIGGVISASGPASGTRSQSHFLFKNTVNSTIVHGVICETETGITPDYVFYQPDSSSFINGLSVFEANCPANTAIFGGGAGCKSRNIKFFGSAAVGGGVPALINQVANSGGNEVTNHITDSIFGCEGLNITPSGTLDSSVILVNPGTVTMPGSAVNNSRRADRGLEGPPVASAYRTIAGRIFTSTTATSGDGWSATSLGTGQVALTFSPAFSAIPVVSPAVERATGATARTALVVSPGTTGVTIETYNAGSAEDNEVHFVVVGKR